VKSPLLLLALCALLIGVAEGQEKKPPSGEATRLNEAGVTLLRDGKVDEAITQLKRAAELAPSSAVIKANLGFAYDKGGKVDEAVAAYRKVLELEPGNNTARNNLGNLLTKQGQFEEATREFEELLRRDPDNAAAKSNLEIATKNQGITKEKQDQVSGALQAAAAKPADPQAAYAAARVYSRLGDQDNAISWLTKALDLGYDRLEYLSVDPSLTGLRKDPRFLKLLEERRAPGTPQR